MAQRSMASQGHDELHSIKAIIRALLISEKRPLTVHQFLSEFKSSEGQELPFKQYGFGDPLGFLKSLPDTVRLTRVSNAAEFYVSPTVTKEVQHIHNLVSGQKTTKPLVNRPPPTTKPVNSLKKVERVQDIVNGKKKSKPLVSHLPATSKPVNCVSRPQPVPRAPAVPQRPPNSQPPIVLEEVKDNLRKLLADHISGINVLQLDEVYAHRFGSSINYADFGYKTIEDFVIGMRGILCATRSSAGVMRVFASVRDCRQPPVQGRLMHFSQTSTPVQRPIPCFRAHRGQPVPRSSTASSQPHSRQPPRLQTMVFFRTPRTTPPTQSRRNDSSLSK